jgi:hypothetical protein
MGRCMGTLVSLIVLIVLFVCCCVPIALVVLTYNQWG